MNIVTDLAISCNNRLITFNFNIYSNLPGQIPVLL